MCTVIPFKRKFKPSIARKDIEVYKAGFEGENNTFQSPYHTRFFYTKDVLYTEKFEYDDCGGAYDDKETHYQYNLTYATSITTGFHAFTTLDKERMNAGDKTFYTFGKFIIPKGSNYFRNITGCIVSETIIFKEFIE